MLNLFIISGATLAATLLQVLPVAAVPTAALAESPIPGYRVEAMTWEIQTNPGGPTVNLTGTIQQVIQFAEKQNPNFRSDFGLDAPADLGFKSPKTLDECGKGHRPCTHDNFQSVECVLKADMADLGTFEDIIGDLSQLPGNPGYAPGPGFCSQLGCEGQTAVL